MCNGLDHDSTYDFAHSAWTDSDRLGLTQADSGNFELGLGDGLNDHIGYDYVQVWSLDMGI